MVRPERWTWRQTMGGVLLHCDIQMPKSFTAWHSMCASRYCCLISSVQVAKLHCGAIMALVGLDNRHNRLHIDVAPILPDQVLGVTHYPAIVNLCPSNLHRPASVMMPDASISKWSLNFLGMLLEHLSLTMQGAFLLLSSPQGPWTSVKKKVR